MRVSGTIFVWLLSNSPYSKTSWNIFPITGGQTAPHPRGTAGKIRRKLQTLSSCSIEWPTCACLNTTKSTGLYRYMDPNCSLMSTGRRMYCIWKWSFRPRAGQISCFGVILAKISRRTCDRDSHLFQATICGGSRGTHVINVIKRLGSISGNFGGKGLLRVKNLTLGLTCNKTPGKTRNFSEIPAKFKVYIRFCVPKHASVPSTLRSPF